MTGTSAQDIFKESKSYDENEDCLPQSSEEQTLSTETPRWRQQGNDSDYIGPRGTSIARGSVLPEDGVQLDETVSFSNQTMSY